MRTHRDWTAPSRGSFRQRTALDGLVLSACLQHDLGGRMTIDAATDQPEKIDRHLWRRVVAGYERPIHAMAVRQVINSFGPYLSLWGLLIWIHTFDHWIVFPLTVLLAIPAAGFLVRIFIIAHDCGHGSFFRSRRANSIVGAIGSTLALTPYGAWRYQHAVHHATSGDLDHRDLGDVWTLTVEEYRDAPLRRRLGYRLYRHPFVLLGLGPLSQFCLAPRFPRKNATPKERRSVLMTNLALLCIVVLAASTIGIGTFLMIQLPIIMIAGSAGIWLFYVQHQFEGVYWERSESWDYFQQAIDGSSYFALPRVLQWFSGNIGFHHVHHLSPRIPNYLLEKCHREQPLLHRVSTVTLRSSLECLRFRLWDEDRRQLVGFDALDAAR